MNRDFSKENRQMTNGHMKRHSVSQIIRELKIKTRMRYHLIPVNHYPQKEQKYKMLVRMWRKLNTYTLLGECK